jgi:hypothetical protein
VFVSVANGDLSIVTCSFGTTSLAVNGTYMGTFRVSGRLKFTSISCPTPRLNSSKASLFKVSFGSKS